MKLMRLYEVTFPVAIMVTHSPQFIANLDVDSVEVYWRSRGEGTSENGIKL